MTAPGLEIHVSSISERPGEAEWLRTYRMGDYERPSVTVDLAVFSILDGVFSVLLVKRAEHPYKDFWALPGGFAQPGESLEDAAWRELHEETGVEHFGGHLEQLRTYGDANRDPRGWIISVAHVAMAPDLPAPTAGSDAAEARWWPVTALGLTEDEPNSVALAFDHRLIIADAVERIRAKFEYSTLVQAFVAAPFPLSAVRAAYAAVWGTAPSRNPFLRKVLATDGFVEPVDGHATPGAQGGKPARLYTWGPATTLYPPLLRTSAHITDPNADTEEE
jgi:8-oxo-dGTP diphosphatase